MTVGIMAISELAKLFNPILLITFTGTKKIGLSYKLKTKRIAAAFGYPSGKRGWKKKKLDHFGSGMRLFLLRCMF